jgi:integrase
MAVLAELKALAMDSQWVLPSSRGLGKRHISSSALNAAIRGIAGIPQGVVIHDLRRTVRTYLSELGVASDVAELCLNHRPAGIRGVYDRSELIEQRYAALQKWQNYLQNLLQVGGASDHAPNASEEFAEVLERVRTDPALKQSLLSALLAQT